jgi:uncharacterized protein DUF6765
MIPFAAMKVVCIALVSVMAAGTANAYDVDFHYYAVYLLLRSRGYDAVAADTLAGFSQYVDDNAQTEPLSCTVERRAQFHFAGSSPGTVTTANYTAARNAVTNAFAAYAAREPAAKYKVGAALHLLADTFSHATYTAYWNRRLNCREGSWRPCIGHADTEEKGHGPDHPYNAPDRALLAAHAIYDLIPPARGGTVVPWKTLEPDLARAFDDSGRPGVDPRIDRLRRVIRMHFPETAHYERFKFHLDKKAYEAAVLR